MIWMDIETNTSPGCGWSSDQSSNCRFIGELLDAATAAGRKAGVYASQCVWGCPRACLHVLTRARRYMWSSIPGSGCTSAAKYPLWYAHYDFKQTFSDFVPFGGWTKPNVKQYSDRGSACGVSADLNWYP
jgi:hypothetical protein